MYVGVGMVSREHVWICSCLVVCIASVAQSVERTALNRTVAGCRARRYASFISYCCYCYCCWC